MNGTALAVPVLVSHDLRTVIEAIQLIYDPLSPNERRQDASSYLQTAKRHPDIPLTLTIASQGVERSQASEVRHYGLSMLEFIISHRLEELENEQLTALREWIVQMAKDVVDADPPYIRNKIAQLWLELLKRTWATEWMDMDEQLVTLWNTSLVHKEMVLYILEMASEDIFIREDPSAGLRDNELGKAFSEIFTPASVFQQYYPNRKIDSHLRYGQEGWLLRMRDFLKGYLDHGQGPNAVMRSSAIKTLDTLSAALSWVLPKAIIETQMVDALLNVLTVADAQIQLACVKALVAIYSRSGLRKDIQEALVHLMLQSVTVRMLINIYGWSVVDSNNLDESKYSLCKKLAELISCVGHLLAQCPGVPHDGCDLSSFCTLCMNILQNPSLLVAIPVLHAWVEMLNTPGVADSGCIVQLYAPLLQVSSMRLFRYETLPEGYDDPTVSFLNEDIDTFPERHAFLGNFRRLSVELIECIVRLRPYEAIRHILTQTLAVFNSVYDEDPKFRADTFTKDSPTILRIDAQCTVVAAAVKGFLRAVPSSHGSKSQQHDHGQLQEILELWLDEVLRFEFKDPAITAMLVHVAAECCLRTLYEKSTVPIRVVEKILSLHITDNADFPRYSDAVKELEGTCIKELHRLAMRFPDYLQLNYDNIEIRINEKLNQGVANDRARIGYQAFLFIIVHRSSHMDETVRQARMQEMLRPVQEAWQDRQLQSSLSSFESFCDLLGMSQLPAIFGSLHADGLSDWSSITLDERGKVMQNNILRTLEQLPLRATRALLDASTESLPLGSGPLELARTIWRGAIPITLPHLLQFVKFTHAFHNLANWGQLSNSMRATLQRVLRDRFWQVGISTERRDVFYAKIIASKTTLEGFASSVRGTVREVRETAYGMIVGLGRLGGIFYGIDGLPSALAAAFFDDSEHLSTHQNSILLGVTQALIHGCPPTLRQQFVPPLLAGLFSKVDLKIRKEWTMLEESKSRAAEDDDLGEEMQKESILRALMYSAVNYVGSLIGLQTMDGPRRRDQAPLCEFIFSGTESVAHQRMLENLILFCTHALRIRDSRSCMVITRVFRSLVARFSFAKPAAAPVREFISKDVLIACIESLHEPYFVDVQKDLASVIAAIISVYSAKTTTPRQVILSLPGMTDEKVDRAINRICEPSSERRQRALVLDLLESVRGVSIHEEGRIQKPERTKVRSAIQERYTMVIDEQFQRERGDSPDLGGLADMFGGEGPSVR